MSAEAKLRFVPVLREQRRVVSDERTAGQVGMVRERALGGNDAPIQHRGDLRGETVDDLETVCDGSAHRSVEVGRNTVYLLDSVHAPSPPIGFRDQARRRVCLPSRP